MMTDIAHLVRCNTVTDTKAWSLIHTQVSRQNPKLQTNKMKTGMFFESFKNSPFITQYPNLVKLFYSADLIIFLQKTEPAT